MRTNILIIITIIFITTGAWAQNRIITGQVLSEELESLPFVKIRINDTVDIGVVDNTGRFSITIPNDSEKLKFLFVGMLPAIVLIPKTCNDIEIIMLYSCNYDFISSRKVNRLEKKRINKLPELHLSAYIKGLFKNDKPCFDYDYNYRVK